MAGSSFFRIIKKQGVYSATGPTGSTGPTGPTGPVGYGPTGSTGIGISHIGLCFGRLLTEFTDGSTFITSNVIQGPEGNTVTKIAVNFKGTTGNIVFSQAAENEIVFRSIKGVSSTSGRSKLDIKDIGNTLQFSYVSNVDGYTFTNVGIDVLYSFAGTTGTGLSLTNVRSSNYDPSNASSNFTVRNVVEKARGLGFSGATQYQTGITCNYVKDGKIDGFLSCKIVNIDPSCKANNSIDNMTTNKTFVVDLQGNRAKFIIGRPPSSIHSTAFTLVVKNAANSEIGSEKRFQSPFNNLFWPFDKEPCFGGSDNTDVYHFYSLFDSWFGSVAYSSRYESAIFNCPGFDGNPSTYGACCELDSCPPIKNVIQIEANANSSAVVYSNRQVRTWGFNGAGMLNVPTGITFREVSIGGLHMCGIYEPGGITCWGSPSSTVKTPNNLGYTSISCGAFHNIAINSSGGITTWGSNLPEKIPAGLVNVKQVSAGFVHSLALLANGGITCWFENTNPSYNYGQCNVPTGYTFISIAAYDFGGLALTNGGTVFAWGREPVSNNVPSGLTADQIVGSRSFNGGSESWAFARKSNGTIVGWGSTLSTNNYTNIPLGLTPATDIAIGLYHGLVVSGGVVKSWGSDTFGQVTLPCGQCGITCTYKSQENCSGPGKIFRGAGTDCISYPCSITGPCCAIIGCDSESDPAAQCYEGVTLEDCLCGTHPGILQSAQYNFNYGKISCDQIFSCETTLCDGYGSCCLPDGGCDDNIEQGFTESECTLLGGIFNPNQLCQNLPSDYCSRGRCCKIKVDDIGSSPPCVDNTIPSRCTSLDPLMYTQFKIGGNCETDRCYDAGACCTGGNCEYPTYEIPVELNDVYNNEFFELNQICSIGLTGNFLGHNSSCTDDSCAGSSDRGTCVTMTCYSQGGVGAGCITRTERLRFDIDVTKAQCDAIPTNSFTTCPSDPYPGFSGNICKKFFPGIVTNTAVYSTTGKCCSREYVEGSVVGEECTDLSLSECMISKWLCDVYSGCPQTCRSCSATPTPSFSYQVKFDKSPATCATDCSFPTALTDIYSGDYSPASSSLYGKNYKLCCPTTMNNLVSGNEVSAEFYTSKFDWFGYGNVYSNNDDRKSQNVKFKVYVYHKDLEYTDDSGNIIKEVVWGQTDGNCAWGPHVQKTSSGAYTISDLTNTVKSYISYKDEGYWQLTGAGYSAEMLLDHSYNKQPLLQFTDSVGALVNNEDSIYSNNGAWRRNWGLYNTMRMFGADNAFYAMNNPVNKVTYDLPDTWTASRLVDKLNRESTLNSFSSSWFIPSMDEMAFICSKLPEIYDLLEDPMNGSYWTSTGTFDESSEEGKRSRPASIAQAGTEAWVFSINKNSYDSNALSTFDIKIKKEKRNIPLKVRPIRIEMERSDDIPVTTSEQYKIWRLQPLKWVGDKLGGSYV